MDDIDYTTFDNNMSYTCVTYSDKCTRFYLNINSLKKMGFCDLEVIYCHVYIFQDNGCDLRTYKYIEKCLNKLGVIFSKSRSKFDFSMINTRKKFLVFEISKESIKIYASDYNYAENTDD